MTCKNEVEEVLQWNGENIWAVYLLHLFEISRLIPIVNNNLTMDWFLSGHYKKRLDTLEVFTINQLSEAFLMDPQRQYLYW